MVQGLDMRFLGGKEGLKNMVKTTVIESVVCAPEFVHALGQRGRLLRGGVDGLRPALLGGNGKSHRHGMARAI
jgi:hypothetical protein